VPGIGQKPNGCFPQKRFTPGSGNQDAAVDEKTGHLWMRDPFGPVRGEIPRLSLQLFCAQLWKVSGSQLSAQVTELHLPADSEPCE
jgi:hypothetical protein